MGFNLSASYIPLSAMSMTQQDKVSNVDCSWGETPLRQRCRKVAKVASVIAEGGEKWAAMCLRDWREDSLTTVSGELLPLCAALKWIGKVGPKVLGPSRLSVMGRPIWLWGVRNEIHRAPHGEVLILGSWNYPLLLVGVQIAQALAAGNRVLFKPAEGCEEISRELTEAFYACGIPHDALRCLDSSASSAIAAIERGVDLIVLTGSAKTGKAVFRQAADTLTPMILELSGCDAVVACPDANFQRVADCVVFGLTFNGGATCIGPRRLIAEHSDAQSLLQLLLAKLSSAEAVAIHPAAKDSVIELIGKAFASGAIDLTGQFSLQELKETGRMRPLVLGGLEPDSEIANADVFAPVITLLSVEEIKDCVAIINQCRYRLAASVFGRQPYANQLAEQLHVGSVTVNDLIVPTADPRTPFGGRGESGFGVTRGKDGLLAMSIPVLKSQRKGSFLPHLYFNRDEDSKILLASLQLLHGVSIKSRWRGLRRMIQNARRRGN